MEDSPKTIALHNTLTFTTLNPTGTIKDLIQLAQSICPHHLIKRTGMCSADGCCCHWPGECLPRCQEILRIEVLDVRVNLHRGMLQMQVLIPEGASHFVHGCAFAIDHDMSYHWWSHRGFAPLLLLDFWLGQCRLEGDARVWDELDQPRRFEESSKGIGLGKKEAHRGPGRCHSHRAGVKVLSKECEQETSTVSFGAVVSSAG